MTPAQAYGHPDFVTDVPVQGPTDEGLRAADCWFAKNRIPTRSPCVDCGGGSIPMLSQVATGCAERLSFGGRGVLGFALEAPGDPEIWSKITPDQQMWISNSLNTLNSKIVSAGSPPCPTWGPAINLVSGCFQVWFNANMKAFTDASGKPVTLRTDGVFDQQTLDALRTTVALYPKDFPTPYPGTQMAGTTGTGDDKKLSTGAMVGIAAASAAALGGVVWLATKKKK